jgi:hypothetical protein
VGTGVEVAVRVGNGVTVGGAPRGVPVGYRVAVANGVSVTVGVAVGIGVPGVLVGVSVGDDVTVLVGVRTRVRVGPGPWVNKSSSSFLRTTVLREVAVGSPVGFWSGNRSQAEATSATKHKRVRAKPKA